jgi:uncharacterized SAM-binding protein YcdF (DUF218 family)
VIREGGIAEAVTHARDEGGSVIHERGSCCSPAATRPTSTRPVGADIVPAPQRRRLAILSLQAVLTTLLLPPLFLVLAALAGGLFAWRRAGGRVAAAAAAGVLLFATPFVSGQLIASLWQGPAGDPPRASPGAIVILSADAVRRGDGDGWDVGPLTLERQRAGAALHRRTGLPVLVTGGPIRPGDPPIALLMARSLAEDFGVAASWIEPEAGDTRDNAVLGAAMLRAAGIEAAYVVTHAWHMRRSLEAFGRTGFSVVAAPVRIDGTPDGRSLSDWLPRADRLGASWFALREWAGRLAYALRDGGAR